MTLGHVLENGLESQARAYSKPTVDATDECTSRGDKCAWTENDAGAFETSCGEVFEFTTGTPKENKFRFCPCCGKELDTPNTKHTGKSGDAGG